MLYCVLCAVMLEISSSACSEKVSLRVYLESVDTKYGAANYGFKFSCPGHFQHFRLTNGVLFGTKNIVQVSSF